MSSWEKALVEERPITERQQTEELAERVADRVVSETVSAQVTRVVQTLLASVKGDVHKSALESLLLYRGRVAQKRDMEWRRVMAAIWTNHHDDEELPTNPHEMQALILGWQADRERTIRNQEFRKGVEQTWYRAYQEGVKLGFGGSQMDKPLEEILKAASLKKISF